MYRSATSLWYKVSDVKSSTKPPREQEAKDAAWNVGISFFEDTNHIGLNNFMDWIRRKGDFHPNITLVKQKEKNVFLYGLWTVSSNSDRWKFSKTGKKHNFHDCKEHKNYTTKIALIGSTHSQWYFYVFSGKNIYFRAFDLEKTNCKLIPTWSLDLTTTFVSFYHSQYFICLNGF